MKKNKKKKAPKMVRASQKPVSDVDMIADKVLEKFLDRVSEEITKPVNGKNPFAIY